MAGLVTLQNLQNLATLQQSLPQVATLAAGLQNIANNLTGSSAAANAPLNLSVNATGIPLYCKHMIPTAPPAPFAPRASRFPRAKSALPPFFSAFFLTCSFCFFFRAAATFAQRPLGARRPLRPRRNRPADWSRPTWITRSNSNNRNNSPSRVCRRLFLRPSPGRFLRCCRHSNPLRCRSLFWRPVSWFRVYKARNCLYQRHKVRKYYIFLIIKKTISATFY